MFSEILIALYYLFKTHFNNKIIFISRKNSSLRYGCNSNHIRGLQDGRVARPFGFALTDPDVRLSRIRLLPELNRCVA